jgi:hypothetical protein
VLSDPIGALAHLELARGYVLSGETGKAEGKNRKFLSVWKDADTDMEMVKQAKAEYAKLQ